MDCYWSLNLVRWDLLARAEVDANRFELFRLDDDGRSRAAKGFEVNCLPLFSMLDSDPVFPPRSCPCSLLRRIRGT